ncbi:hypothetical protein DM02DRAFT_561966 [Periconia macrospinosa]|uniref:CENP-V/GFA domain-containing protein n=1 Tax=Periconia macrospinosa TaxID=97972 RepID=A0A2V1DT27_9PLEO|nr:hypothetical protein DM02DRAFT_561966 [Periconia macrospinosa]
MSSTKVYDGGCHCGNVKYKIRLDLPPSTDEDPFKPGTRIYKCNCTTCLKLGMFHTRPKDPANDFILTSPSTIEELGIYNAFGGKNQWYFCKKCGVHAFGVGAEWISTELDVEKWAAGEEGGNNTQKVWKTAELDYVNPKYPGKKAHYVSANAITLEEVDLIEWHDKGWIMYIDNRNPTTNSFQSTRYGKPYPGGCY